MGKYMDGVYHKTSCKQIRWFLLKVQCAYNFWKSCMIFENDKTHFNCICALCPAIAHGISLLTARCEIIWIQFSIWWKFWLLDKWADVQRRKVASCKKLGRALVIYQRIVNHQYKQQPASSVSSNIPTRRVSKSGREVIKVLRRIWR